MWLKVGELVKCSGLIVCMFYYYYVIGLLMFLVCVDNGYWLYDCDDIVWFYQIQVLCCFGLLFVEIGDYLNWFGILFVDVVVKQIVLFDCQFV